MKKAAANRAFYNKIREKRRLNRGVFFTMYQGAIDSCRGMYTTEKLERKMPGVVLNKPCETAGP